MESLSPGLIGGIIGTLIGAVGAVFGCAASYRGAKTKAQRRLLARVFLWGGLGALAFIAVIWLAVLGYLPHWMIWGAMALWFAALPLVIRWLNTRLAHTEEPPG